MTEHNFSHEPSSELLRQAMANNARIAFLNRVITVIEAQLARARRQIHELNLLNIHIGQVLDWRRRLGRDDGDIVADFAHLTDVDIARNGARLVALNGATRTYGENQELFEITELTLTFETSNERIAVTLRIDPEREADYIQIQMSTGIAFLSDVKPEAVSIPAGGYSTLYYADERHVFVASSNEDVIAFGEPDELRIDSSAEPIAIIRSKK